MATGSNDKTLRVVHTSTNVTNSVGFRYYTAFVCGRFEYFVIFTGGHRPQRQLFARAMMEQCGVQPFCYLQDTVTGLQCIKQYLLCTHKKLFEFFLLMM